MIFSKKEPHPLQEALDSAREDLKGFEPWSDEYQKTLASIKSLEDSIRKDEKPSVDKNTLVAVAGGTLQIVLMVLLEAKGHAFLSKGMGLLTKTKLPH